MWIGIGNIIPITKRPIGGGAPPPAVCYIELETSGGTDYVELEPAASTDVMVLELCGGTPPTFNLLAQNNDNLIAQNNDQLIQQ